MSGSGGGGGYEYQAQVTAYIAAHILTEHPLHWIEHSTLDIPVVVAAETDGPGDNINIRLQDDTFIELQAKHGLKKDKKFWEAIIKLIRGLVENSSLYGILLTDSTASATIRDDLRRDIERLGQERTDGLKAITHEVIYKLNQEGIIHSSEVFKRFRIVIADFDNSQRNAKVAQILLSQILNNSSHDEDAWKILVSEGLNLITNKGRRDVKGLSWILSRSFHLSSTGKNPTVLIANYRVRLDNLILWSKAACIASWQSVGVQQNEALALVDDLAIGLPPVNIHFSPGKLIILVGEMGVGKSLIGQRLFQTAIQDAMEKMNAPFPIFLEAGQIQGRSIEKIVREDAGDLCNPSNEPTLIIIDEVDELGISNAIKLLKECRILVRIWTSMTILLISKPILEFVDAKESITVNLLSKEESESLIKRLSGRQYFSYQSLSKSVQDAILRPLFAVLLASHLQEKTTRIPQSKEQLLSSLVERSLRPLREHILNASKILEQLAVLCIDRASTKVPLNEITSWTERQQLLNSRLIVEDADSLKFPLPILSQWFAAQSLISDSSLIEKIAKDRQRLELWQYPLVIAVATFPPNQISKLLTPIVTNQPALAANIVSEALAFQGRSPEMPTQTPVEIGWQVRTAMQAWIKGFSPFIDLISPVQKDGTVPTIGVRFNQKQILMVEIAWYFGDEHLPDIVELPPSPSEYRYLFSLGWNDIREFPPYSHTSWVWKWTLERVVSSLLKSRSLPVESGYLSREAAWFAGLYLTRSNPRSFDPIPVSKIESILCKIDHSRLPSTIRHCIRQLRIEVDAAHKMKQTHLSLSSAVQRFKTTPISTETLLAYVISVYEGAFQGYIQLVNLLDRYLPKLPLASILPARLTIVLVPPALASGSVIWSWYWEPLSPNSPNEIVGRISERPLSNNDSEVQAALEKIELLYPQLSSYFSVKPKQLSPCTQSWLGNFPVTTLSYQWLWQDLKKVSWLTTDFTGSDAEYWLPVVQSYYSGWD